MTAISKFNFSQFDPIAFLGLEHLEASKKKQLRLRLFNNISEYLLIRLLDLLPKTVDKEIDFRKITTVEELMSVFKKYLPDLEKKIKLILNDFKKRISLTL